MKFKSVDEIFNFDFQDSVVKNMKFNDKEISFDLTGLIVEPENSQNENFTKSYADTVKVRFIDGKLLGGIKDGYRQYDANDKLIDEVSDEQLDVDQMKLILKNAGGVFLYAMDSDKDSEEGKFIYNISIEFPPKEQYDTCATVSYQFKISFSKAIFEWDRYLNRVQ